MRALGKNEFLSLVDGSHFYRRRLHKLSFPYTLAYLALLSMELPENGEGEVPLSRLSHFFSKSVQVQHRRELESLGILVTSRAAATAPTVVLRRSIVLAPAYKTAGPGPNILQPGDKHFLMLLKSKDLKARSARPDAGKNKERLPRKWCRAFLLDLLYRCHAPGGTVRKPQKDFLGFVSRCTQWRGRKLLAEVGRIRRDWIRKAGACHNLRVTLEPLPTSPARAKKHPHDRPFPRRIKSYRPK